ncbi:MAG: isocitrate lyase/phosphoenolpyruvate mutase family protein [Lachnospiraceae bacterium]|nr:isocitrate lyase/phosphoenolpyruvate mutase family protein [Lachnospiraceae bacterium]
MKALILNSGLGTRMGRFTSEHPKCMTEISNHETILSRQLHMLSEAGIRDIVITTGPFEDILINYVNEMELPLSVRFVNNPVYRETNYIYSIYLAKDFLDDDIILMHGDLVFENEVLDRLLSSEKSRMVISSTLPLPQKDFKAVIPEDTITKVGINFFEDAFAAQPLYLLRRPEIQEWLSEIIRFCESGTRKCYAEEAFNEISSRCPVYPLDVENLLCGEIDNPEDLSVISERLKTLEHRSVYMCFSTDILHGGHFSILKRAARLGRLTVGVLSDEAVATYKRFPLLPCADRMAMFENLSCVYRVVEQKTLSYRENIEKYRPDIVVHGDDWRSGVQHPVRSELLELLSAYGGKLIEYPYSEADRYKELEKRGLQELSLPDLRRSRLKRLLEMKNFVSVMEAHDGLSALLVENTVVCEEQHGGTRQFDAILLNPFCDSLKKGRPDAGSTDPSARFSTIDEIAEVTTKPIVFDCGCISRMGHFIHTVHTLERMGVSMLIVDDGMERKAPDRDTEKYLSGEIRAGKDAQKTRDFMICVRTTPDRALSYAASGADAVLLQADEPDAEALSEFIRQFRLKNKHTCIAAVAQEHCTEETFRSCGVQLLFYENPLILSGLSAMRIELEQILKNGRMNNRSFEEASSWLSSEGDFS